MRTWLVIFFLPIVGCAHGPPKFAEHDQTDETLGVVRRAFLYAVREPSFARARWSDCRMHLESFNSALRQIGRIWRARFRLDPYCEAELPTVLDGKSDIEVDVEMSSRRLLEVRFLGGP